MNEEGYITGLVAAGFTGAEAKNLIRDTGFPRKTVERNELRTMLKRISEFYKCSPEQLKQAVLAYPRFVSADHEERFGRILNIYGIDNEPLIKKAIFRFPQFLLLDHQRVIDQAVEVYGAENGDRINRAILSQPAFTSLDHQRVIDQAVEVYGAENGDRIKKAILNWPAFAGLNHERAVRQKSRLGAIVGLSREDVISLILEKPVMAGYSFKRYIAALDIARTLEKEGFVKDRTMLDTYFRNHVAGHYVPETNKKRISKTRSGKEPQLLKIMRKALS